MPDMPQDPRILPGWFIKATCSLFSVVVLGAVPWAWHVSSTLTEMQVKMEHASKAMEGLPVLESRMNTHMADPTIHQAGLARINDRLDSLEKRIVRHEDDRP